MSERLVAAHLCFDLCILASTFFILALIWALFCPRWVERMMNYFSGKTYRAFCLALFGWFISWLLGGGLSSLLR